MFKTSSPGTLETVLDDFEQASIRISRPDGTTPETTLMWNQYENDPTFGPNPGSEQLTTDEAYSGSKSLEITVDASNLDMQFYNTISSTERAYCRELILTPSEWQLDTFNRLEFWCILPPGTVKNTTTTTNMHWASYFRGINGARNSNESDGGNHYYHYFNVEHTGRWHKFLVDFHPNAIRGLSGATEHGNRQYPTNQAGYNYFDLLTRFYVRKLGGFPTYPAIAYFDRFRFYKEPNIENEDQVYSINGVYNPSDNKLQVGWKRDKDENTVDHEVYYAFSNIHDLGISGATLAPNGVITPPGFQGYNGMDYTTTSITMGANTSIFVAVKPVNSTLFKQIEIPLT